MLPQTTSEPTSAATGAIDNMLAAFGDPQDAQVEVLTRFLETMAPVQPVSPGTSFRLFLNASGLIDIYSVGTGSEVFRLRRLNAGDAAYSDTDLGIVSRMPSVFLGASGLDTPDIMGVDLSGQLTLATWNTATKRYDQRVEQPANPQGRIGQFKATNVGGIIYANVVLEDGTVGSNFLENGQWASRRWVPVKTPDGGSDAKALAITMCQNNPLQNALYAISESRSVWFADSRNAFTRFTDLGFLRIDDISVLQDSENLLNIFAIGRRADRPEDPTQIWVKRQKKFPVEPGRIEWEDWAKVANGVRFRELRTTVDGRGDVNVFGIEDDVAGRLFIVRELRNSRGRRTGWGPLVALGNPVPNALFEVAQDASGLAEAYSVTRGANVGGDAAAQALETVMYRFWQDPQTTQWFSEPIRIDEPTEAVSLPTYAVEMQVKDKNGTPVPFADLTLTSSVLATFQVNGRDHPVSRLRSLAVEADASGRAVVYYVTGSLVAPTLGVQLAGVQADQGLTIEPNAQLQDRLYTVTKDDVLAAKGAGGQPLLPGSGPEREQNAEAIAQISRKAMSIGRCAPPLGAAGVVPFLGRNPSLTGLRYHRDFRTTDPFALRMEEVPEQHWRVSFDGGLVHYQELDRDEAAVHLATMAVGASAAAGFLGIDWGDIWQSIKNGVGTIFEGLKEFFVTTIIDPVTRLVKELKVVFSVVIDGVHHLIDKTIKFFQQAFDIIEGIWNQLKVFFEDLFHWLAFIFDLGDIQRTAAVVRYSIDVSLDFAVIAVENIKETVRIGIDGFTTRLKHSVDQFVGTLEPNESYRQFMDKHQNAAGHDQARATEGHNVVLNAYNHNYPRTTDDGAALSLLVGDDNPAQQIFDKLKALGENFEFGAGKEAFEEGLLYFSDIARRPGDVINLAFAGLIRVLESLALTGIAIGRGVILSILDLLSTLLKAVKQVANTRFEIPVLSPVYKFFTCRDLSFSMLDVASLIVAIPANIAYKIATGAAPFPDDAAVDRFRRAVTAKKLARLAGFKIDGRALGKVSQRALAAVSTYTKVAGFILAGSFLVRAVTEPLVNLMVGAAQVKDNLDIGGGLGDRIRNFNKFGVGAKFGLALVNVLLRVVASVFTLPWLLSGNAGRVACDSGQAFGNLVWIFQAALGPLLGFIALLVGVVKGYASTINLFRLLIWGVVHLIMVIVQAALGGFANGLLIARGILGTLAPQATWILLHRRLIVESEGVSLVGQMALSVVDMLAMSVLTFIATATLNDADFDNALVA